MKLSVKVGQQILDVLVVRQDADYVVEVDGRRFVVNARKLEGDFFSILTEGRSYEVSVEADGDGYWVRHGAAEQRVAVSDPSRQAREEKSGPEGPEQIVSVMPGKVVRLLAREGDAVEPGQGVVVVEAMKMENEIASDKGGRVTRVAVSPGDAVETGTLLMVVE